MISTHSLPKKKKLWRWIVLIVAIILIKLFLGWNSLNLHETIVIQQGDTFQKFVGDFSSLKKAKLKIYFFTHRNFDLGKIQEGSYVFSGSYSFNTFLTQILKGPTQNYIRYTVLEGRSIYDIDADLAQKGYIASGEYIALASDSTIIAKYETRYDFLANLNLPSLEGFLYPDTYHIDANKNFVDQLIYMQLEAFKSKIWIPYSGQLLALDNRLQLNGINLTSFSLTPYKIITLASVVEKEERNTANKPTVAGIFLKRLSIGMRLDADITLCYGLKTGYETCTPALIAKSVDDSKNPYNTRVKGGLPPTPICSPTVSSVESLLNFTSSNYLFYLHDMNGQIHYGRTSAEHTANKNQYLK